MLFLYAEGFAGAVEFLNYTGSHRVPLGFRLNVECVPTKGAPITQIVNIHESKQTFQFSLPPLGQFECIFTGHNSVWRTQPKVRFAHPRLNCLLTLQNHTVTATIPLILGGIGISAKVGTRFATGCGRRYNVFEQSASITLSVDILQGDTKEVQWYLKNLDSLAMHFKRTTWDARNITTFPLDVINTSLSINHPMSDYRLVVTQ